MPRERAVVVDDEADIRDVIRIALESEGFEVEEAADGPTALALIRQRTPHVVILDSRMPGMDGEAVCRALKRDVLLRHLPVLLVTAKRETADKVQGLGAGADDYIVKPFSPRELVARVRAVVRRLEQAKMSGDVLRAGDLILDTPRMRVTVAGRPAELSPTEFQLLAAMAKYPGRVFTRSQLLDAVHGVAFESYERAIDAHVKNIRRKIEPDPRHPRYLLTVYGVGYRLADQ